MFLPAVFQMELDRVGDIGQSLFVCVSLRVATLQKRAGDEESIFVSLDHDGEEFRLHTH